MRKLNWAQAEKNYLHNNGVEGEFGFIPKLQICSIDSPHRMEETLMSIPTHSQGNIYLRHLSGSSKSLLPA